jgi:drug/metabolite transporter (DMT)-like permease
VPVLVALLAWAVLGEALSLGQTAGLMITLASVTAVLLRRKPDGAPDAEGPCARGIAYAGLAALLQAAGLVVARAGVTTGVSATAATLLRVAPTAVLLVLVGRTKAELAVEGGGTAEAETRPGTPQMLALGGAVLVSTVLSTLLQTYALQHTGAGVCAVLGATYPLWMMPLSRILGIQADRGARLPTVGAVVGVGMVTALAV